MLTTVAAGRPEDLTTQPVTLHTFAIFPKNSIQRPARPIGSAVEDGVKEEDDIGIERRYRYRRGRLASLRQITTCRYGVLCIRTLKNMQ